VPEPTTDDRPPIDSLISLLGDEDVLVSALAMEELLQRDDQIDGLLAEHQEADDDRLRSRIHQMGNVTRIRREREELITGIRQAQLELWDGILRINHQYNTRLNLDAVERLMVDFAGGISRPVSGNRIAQYMVGEGFATARENVLGADLYLADDVLSQRIGSPILLACIAQELGRRVGWSSTIVLYKGKHCLIDAQNNFIEPAEAWRVSKFTPDVQLHPCADKDLWLTILCQLYLAAMLEGRVQAIHRVGSILATLCDGRFHDLPFPLGC